MKRFRIPALLLAAACLAGCAARQIAQPLSEVADLGADEGLFLLVLHSPNEGDTRFFFRGSQASVETPGLPKGSHRVLLRMPAGDYEMTALYVGSLKLLAEDYLQLTIEPGHLTYPGDLVMDGFTFSHVDLSEQRFAELVDERPELAGWPAIVGGRVVHNRRKTSDGVRRVPNTSGRIPKEDTQDGTR